MQAFSPILAQAAGYAVGWWGSGGQRCFCSCDVTGSVDRDLIAVLQRQLDRCGPDQLTAPPPATCHCDTTATWLSVAAGFCIGLLVGILLCLVVYFRAVAHRRDGGAAAGPGLAALDDAGGAAVRAVPGRRLVAREGALRARAVGRVVLGGPDSDSGSA